MVGCMFFFQTRAHMQRRLVTISSLHSWVPLNWAFHLHLKFRDCMCVSQCLAIFTKKNLRVKDLFWFTGSIFLQWSKINLAFKYIHKRWQRAKFSVTQVVYFVHFMCMCLSVCIQSCLCRMYMKVRGQVGGVGRLSSYHVVLDLNFGCPTWW